MTPNLSVFAVILIVLLLAGLLDRLLFKPVIRIIKERQGRVEAARHLAEQAAARAADAVAEFETKTGAARAEVYRQMDEARRAALAHRAEILAATRSEAEAAVAGAIRQLQAEKAEAQAGLAREAEALGVAAAERILGRKVS